MVSERDLSRSGWPSPKRGSKRVGFEHLVDVAFPRPAIRGEQPVGRRAPLLDDLDQRCKRLALVLSVAIEPGAPLQAAKRQVDHFAAYIAQATPAKRRLKSKPRHRIAQGLALLRRPVGDEGIGGIERRPIIKK